MSKVAAVSLSTGDRIDLLVKNLNDWSPIVWLLILGYFLYFTYKELKDFNKKSAPNLQEIHDMVDDKTFEKSVMPLMIQLDAQVYDYAQAGYDEALEEHNGPFSDPIAKYEEIRAKTIQEMDISTIAQALELTESLREATKVATIKSSCDKRYRTIRNLLKVAFVTLILNIVAGIGLIVTSTSFSETHYSRWFFVVWAGLLTINLVIFLWYAISNIMIDGYRKKYEDK